MMDRYSTHLETLRRVVSETKPNNILEFGMGKYSTPFFLENCEKLISIEMQDESWFNLMKLSMEPYNHKWTPILNIGCDFEKIVPLQFFDIVFVDGHGDCRPECVNFSFNLTDIIIVHDYDRETYGWERINMPNTYKMQVDFKLTPHTAIFYKIK